MITSITMKIYYYLIIAALVLTSCEQQVSISGTSVSDMEGLMTAIGEAEPGSVITMANGTYKDVQIEFYGEGTEDEPITLRAETAGEVFIEGQSSLHLGGKHLIVDGLYFRNGYSPSGGVIRYQIGEDKTAFHSQVTNCVIEDFTMPNRWQNNRWVEFYGKHNKMDHCYIAGKGNDGATVMVYHSGNKHTRNYHEISHNYFGPRPRKGGPRGETMRIGGSETSMTPGYVTVSNNYFEACNGEVEVISDKTNFNSFRNNIFNKCEGSLVMRHSDYATIDGNIFIGDDDSDFYGGIRLVNSGHTVTNNYLYKIRGEEFRSPLAVMNGIPKSSLNRYMQVHDAVIAFNTWVDCRAPIQIGVGQNVASAGVLPPSEIRSAAPIRTIVADNLIYNSEEDRAPVVNHDDMSGITFAGNVIDNGGARYTQYDALQNGDVNMTKVNEWLYAPTGSTDGILDSVAQYFESDKVETDIFGASRADNNQIGAIVSVSAAEQFKINTDDYGPSWFNPKKEASAPKLHSVAAESGALASALAEASSGDIIDLTGGAYTVNGSLAIDKEITIRSKSSEKAIITFTGGAGEAAFQMHGKGNLKLQNVAIKSKNGQVAFAPLEENMYTTYQLSLADCVVEDFSHVLHATKGSFADSINMTNTLLQNCDNGIVLAAEEKGDYNAEMITINDCTFKGIDQNVIHFFRGGYDESTIGGFLRLDKSTFTECGRKEKSGVLVKTRGIINVHMFDNLFTNNPIRYVAVLWGAKNNNHEGNTVSNSGQIKVEQQQKLELLY